MRIAVTGASGFIGGTIARTLVAAGHRVHAFGRRPSMSPLRVAGAPYRAWDISRSPLADAPQVDVVIHCAGSVSDWGPAAEFQATNVQGTAHVLASFALARFVHISTASVYDPDVPTVMATEAEAPVAQYRDEYGASKAAAERLVSTAMRDRSAIILRPHAVYGPGDTTLLPRVLASVRGRWLLAVGDGRQRISLTSVGNLAQAARLAATGKTERGVFNVADEAPIVLDAALREILSARGIAASPLYLPLRFARTLAAGAERVATAAHPPRLTRYAVDHLAVERTLNLAAARMTLGYVPAATTFTGAASW